MKDYSVEKSKTNKIKKEKENKNQNSNDILRPQLLQYNKGQHCPPNSGPGPEACVCVFV